MQTIRREDFVFIRSSCWEGIKGQAQIAAKKREIAANEGQLREMKRAMETTAQDSNRSRMTPEALKEERIGMLRQKDPALGAAIDELDLELLD